MLTALTLSKKGLIICLYYPGSLAMYLLTYSARDDRRSTKRKQKKVLTEQAMATHATRPARSYSLQDGHSQQLPTFSTLFSGADKLRVQLPDAVPSRFCTVLEPGSTLVFHRLFLVRESSRQRQPWQAHLGSTAACLWLQRSCPRGRQAE